MFDQLFARQAAVARHRSAPYVAERERYLRHLAMLHYSLTSQRRAAHDLLAIVLQTDLAGRRRVTGKAVREANRHRSSLHRGCRRRCSEHARESLRRTATAWMVFLGRLAADPEPVTRDSVVLKQFEVRASETASLRIQDVDTRSRLVRITGKGNKLRVCPLWPETVGHLRRLIAERSKDEPLFQNRLKQPLTRFGIHTLVERHAAHAAEHEPSLRSKRVSPHTIRHSTATHLLRAGVDINTIRGWLGHASINTTNVYAEVDLDAKAKALAACSPGTAGKSRLPWKSAPGVMEFLRTL
jgi:site-specific recombinase XerC